MSFPPYSHSDCPPHQEDHVEFDPTRTNPTWAQASYDNIQFAEFGNVQIAQYGTVQYFHSPSDEEVTYDTGNVPEVESPVSPRSGE